MNLKKIKGANIASSRGRHGTGTVSQKIFSSRDSSPKLSFGIPRPAWVLVPVIDPGFLNFESRSRSQIPDFLMRPGPSPESRIFQISVPVPVSDPQNLNLSPGPSPGFPNESRSRNVFRKWGVKNRSLNLMILAIINSGRIGEIDRSPADVEA